MTTQSGVGSLANVVQVSIDPGVVVHGYCGNIVLGKASQNQERQPMCRRRTLICHLGTASWACERIPTCRVACFMALARSIEVMGSGDPRPGTVCVWGGGSKGAVSPLFWCTNVDFWQATHETHEPPCKPQAPLMIS